MRRLDCAAEKALVSLNESQRQALADFIERERVQAIRWWTHLNELRCRGQLPDWAYKNIVGTGIDHELWSEACVETNQAIFGKKHDIRSADERPPIQTFLSADDSPTQELEKVLGRVKQPGLVRQHRPGRSTLDSTNARA